MALPKPYGGLSNDRLTALINFYNPDRTIQEGVDFTYGPPQAYTDAQGRNTKVTLTPVSGTQSTQPEDVHYWRLAIGVLSLLPEGVVQQVVIDSFPFSIHTSLDAINEALGVDLALDEVEDATYAEPQDSYTLTVLGVDSLAWLNSTYEFQVRLSEQDIPLSEIIIQRELSGLIYSQPVP